MVNVTAATSFLGNEGMWRRGETKLVSAHRAHELIEEGLVIESSTQPEPAHPLQPVADALGATIVETGSTDLQPVADALGATVTETDPAEAPVTTASVKGDKKKPSTDEAPQS